MGHLPMTAGFLKGQGRATGRSLPCLLAAPKGCAALRYVQSWAGAILEIRKYEEASSVGRWPRRPGWVGDDGLYKCVYEKS